MTDSIDLDELDAQDDDESPNRGDWLWRGDGDPDAEPDETADALAGDDLGSRTPRVPSENEGRPVGIPTDRGGAGSGIDDGVPSGGGMPNEDAAPDTTPAEGDADDAGVTPDGSSTDHGVWEHEESDVATETAVDSTGNPADVAGEQPTSSGSPGSVSGPVGSGDQSVGPHGGDADDMTLAFTYRAARALADPQAACRDATRWTDWLGIVGEVPPYALNKFQRRHKIDLDFFNGSGTRPTERLAEIDRSSMFYAERLVLVGLSDEAGMEPEGWEFRPLSEAAEKAGWEYDLGDS